MAAKKNARKTSTRKSSARRQDIFSVIKKDHRTVESLFKKIAGADSEMECESLYEELRSELTAHADAEEAVVYPRLKEKDATREIAFESVEEHALVTYLLEKLDDTEMEEEKWMAALTVLKEVVSHHVEEEESEMFPKMRRAFKKSELEEMCQDFLHAKQGMLSDSERRKVA